MCKAVDDYAKEYAIEETVKMIKKLVDSGISIEAALKCSSIDLQTYEKYSKKIQ